MTFLKQKGPNSEMYVNVMLFIVCIYSLQKATYEITYSTTSLKRHSTFALMAIWQHLSTVNSVFPFKG